MSDVWVIEMLSEDGDIVGEIVKAEGSALADFVRVNAQDASQFRIARTTVEAAVEAVWDDIDQERALVEAAR